MDSSGVERWLSVYSLVPVAALIAAARLNRVIPRRDALLRWYERTQLARYKLCVEPADAHGDTAHLGTLGATEAPPVATVEPLADASPALRVASDRRREYDIVCDGLAVVEIDGTRMRIQRGQRLRCSGFDDLAFSAVTAEQRSRHADADARFAVEIPSTRRLWILDADLRATPSAFRSGDTVDLPFSQEPYPVRGEGPEPAHKGVRPPWRWLYAVGVCAIAVGVALPAHPWAWWVLMAMLIAGLAARGAQLSALRLPRAAAQLAHDADLATLAEPEVAITMGHLEGPIWLYRMGQPVWLLPQKRTATTEIFVFDFADPHSGETIDARDALVGGAAQYISDRVSLTTDLPASTMIPLLVGLRRARQTHQVFDFAALTRAIGNHPGRQILVWGSADEDLSMGYTVHVRATRPPGDSESTFHGTLESVSEQLIAHLAALGDCTRVTPSAGFGSLDDAQWNLSVDVLELAMVQILSSDRAGAIPAVDAAVHHAAVRFSGALAESVPGYVPFEILQFVCATYAQLAGALEADRRAALLRIVRDAPAESAVGRLAPVILARLGESDAARATREARLALATGAYRTWLMDCLERE